MRPAVGLVDRLVSACLGFFVAALLLYAGVQLVQAVLLWLVVGVAIVALATGAYLLLRWHRERW